MKVVDLFKFVTKIVNNRSEDKKAKKTLEQISEFFSLVGSESSKKFSHQISSH